MAKFEIDIPDDVIADFNEHEGRNLSAGDDAGDFLRGRLAAFIKSAVVQHRVDKAIRVVKADTQVAEDAKVVVGVTVTVAPVPKDTVPVGEVIP